ncbi:MAG: 2-hydroxyacid dehydrogenase [Labrys sp. (in: a-proteobacteria)]
MSKPRIVVTRRWPEAVERKLAADFDVRFNETDRPMDVASLREALETADALMPTVTDKLGPATFEGLKPKVRIIANYGVGYSHIDVEAAKRLGIVVTNTPDVLSECTADIAILLMLMVARRTGEGERELRAHEWTGWRPTHLVGTKVSGKTLGVIGFGRIGQETAKRAHFGFGMRIIAYNRSPIAPETLAATGGEARDSIDAVMAEADFVSLHCPGGAANRHLVDARRLGLMRPGSFLINTARGEVVDEEALAVALGEGRIGGAGLDVYDGEPAVRASLMTAPNAVLLPHLGSATRETREAMGFRALANAEAFFAGQQPPDRVA